MDAAPADLVARERLSALKRPFIVCVLADRTVAATAATMARALYAGADAFELNLPLLADQPREAVRALVQRSARPIYTSCRRAGFMTIYGRGAVPEWADEERMQRQLDLLCAGSAAVDIELDAFDADCGAGISDDPNAVARQRAVAEAARTAGAEALFSCHASVALSAERVAAIAAEAVARGGDLFKLVAPARTTEDALALLAAAARLRREDAVPATIVGSGRPGRFTRLLAPVLGGGWALAQEDLFAGGFPEQPPVRETREALRILSALEAVPDH